MASGESPILQAVLLVGGKGSRLRPLTYQMPKVLLPVLNQPLIGYELELLSRYRVGEVILTTSYQAEQLRPTLGTGEDWGVKLAYIREQRPLDTAGAIKNAEGHITGDFFALNGDLILDCDLAELAQAHQQSGAMVTILLRRVEDISHFGLIQRDQHGFITAFREKVSEDETGQNTVNAGVYVMSPEVLQHIPPDQPYSNESDLFPGLLEMGVPMYGHLPQRQGYWADVGRLDTYLAANRDMLDNQIPWVKWSECSTELTGSRLNIQPPTCCDPNVTVGTGTQIGPYVSLGKGVQIGREAILRDCVILPNVSIGAAVKLESVIVAEGETIPHRYNQTEGVICSYAQ